MPGLSAQKLTHSQEGEKEFGDWLVNHRLQGALSAESSNDKTNLYQSQLQEAIDRCYPITTMRRKSSDPPWINGSVRHKIMKRKRLYKIEGRSDRWKAMKKAIEELIRKRRDTYRTVQLENFTDKDAQRSFFKNIKAYQTRDRPKPFDVRTLCPGRTDQEVSERRTWPGVSIGIVPPRCTNYCRQVPPDSQLP